LPVQGRALQFEVVRQVQADLERGRRQRLQHQLAGTGLSQVWGSGGDRHRWAWIVGWLESLSEAGTERAIIDGATDLEQQIGAASRPAHLL